MVLTLKGRVRAGKVVIDEALNLPEGSEIDLIVVDPGDDLDDDERARLHAALTVAQEEIERGEGIAAALTRLRSAPSAGAAYGLGPRLDVRRPLLPRTRYHVYYVMAGDARRVSVLAVWHTARGGKPRL
jgi:plasmid stabilization system protein ParE